MKIKNVSFKTVQWLAEHGKLRGIERSNLVLMPTEVQRSFFGSSFYDLVELTHSSGEILRSEDVENCLHGFDVEVDEVDGDFPVEILEKLG